jgi:UDP-GlcNAc:undecaprenyl-phosphate GlcNAc-1-phosphate transferase
MAHLTQLDALYAFLVAAAVTALLTPFTMRLAKLVGAVDEPRERGLSSRATPLLGGLAIFAGVVVAGLVFLPAGYGEDTDMWHGVLIAAALITVVGALDDRFDLPPIVKLAGQIAAAMVVVHYGVAVKRITLPFIGALAFPKAGATNAGPALTVIGLVVMMNVVNLSDGVDGLAAGVCVIIAGTLAIIAFDLDRAAPGVLAALTAGAALGFLLHNFPPASSFMGDCGANLLGLLMGVVTVEAAVKTTAVVSFVLPLILLAVPFLDTTFVVLKRLKYRRPIYAADDEHFHHRMARIGFSSRRTIAYLYAWTLMLAGFALALRFVPYSDHKGHLHSSWLLVMVALALVVAAASVYLVYVLEILKFRRLDALRLRRLRPDASPAEIAHGVALDLETGEYEAVAGGERSTRPNPDRLGDQPSVGHGPNRLVDERSTRYDPNRSADGRSTRRDSSRSADGSSPPSLPDGLVVGDVPGGAQQRVGERQVDQDRVGAERERGGTQAAAVGDSGERQRPYRIPGQQPRG